MKKLLATALNIVIILGVTSLATASWDKCKTCHVDADKKPLVIGGKAVPTKANLLEKFKTAGDFVKGSKASESPTMKKFKDDDATLKAAAKDLKLK